MKGWWRRRGYGSSGKINEKLVEEAGRKFLDFRHTTAEERTELVKMCSLAHSWGVNRNKE